MAEIIRMPEVITGVSEATIQSWLVATGDEVSVGTPLAEIETEKATVEFPSETSGTIVELLGQSGTSITVGDPIALLSQPGDSAADIDAARTTTREASPSADKPAEPEFSMAPAGASESASPEAQTPAQAETQPQSQSEEAPQQQFSARVFSSPIVRRLARERGVDLTNIVGTGPGGRIVRRDLDAHLPTTKPVIEDIPQAPQSQSGAPTSQGTDAIITPLTGMRTVIARRLTESKSTVPHFYLTSHCNVDRLLELRATLNETSPQKFSVNDFVVKAAAHALITVPAANAIWGGDHIQEFRSADIAIAVATDGGLLTPVIRSVDRMSLTELSVSLADAAERARAGKLRQAELDGGSFAVSNLGMFGVDEFSAILNPPQSGILAVGAASRRPVVVGDTLAVGTVMTVTLSADHRVIDGAVAAQWLAAFTAAIENPLTVLV